MIITIDGPSGSGKSTLALNLAHHLNFFCLNSGYLYRGLAYVLKTFYQYDEQKSTSVHIADVQACLGTGGLQYRYENGLAKIYWAGDDITLFLKSLEISTFAAMLAQHGAVRLEIRKFEQSLAADRDIVIEGRSCGSVIFPHAEIKFFLDASEQIRAERLQADQFKLGNKISFDTALFKVKQRDSMDTGRTLEPLIKPEGAIVLDSTQDTAQEILQKALDVARAYLQQNRFSKWS